MHGRSLLRSQGGRSVLRPHRFHLQGESAAAAAAALPTPPPLHFPGYRGRRSDRRRIFLATFCLWETSALRASAGACAELRPEAARRMGRDNVQAHVGGLSSTPASLETCPSTKHVRGGVRQRRSRIISRRRSWRHDTLSTESRRRRGAVGQLNQTGKSRECTRFFGYR